MDHHEKLVIEWKKQIERCEKIISRHKDNPHYDLNAIKKIKNEAEQVLKQLQK